MTITRSQVLERARRWPARSVPYSMSKLRDGYRTDCSGYVSMCWAIPPGENGGWGGHSTVTLVTEGYMHEIAERELRPGDAIGRCGPGTAGAAGHIMLVESYESGKITIWEQAGGGPGPVRRTLSGMPSGYRAWRYVGIRDDEPAKPSKPKQTVRPAPGPEVPYPLPENYFFGPASWGDRSVSGLYKRRFKGKTDREWLQTWVNQLRKRGWPAGKGERYLTRFGNDGIYGDEYATLIRAFQRDQGLRVDGLLGPVTWRAAFHNPVTP